METVSGVGVIDKAMLVLRSVADGPQSLGDLQASTGLPRATAHRLAGALEDHGLLRRDGAGRFEFGNDLADLGRIAAARFPLVETARPLLGALRDDTGESVQLFVASGDQRRCVLSLETPHGLRWIVPEGSLFPLGLGSAGRVLLGETLTAGWIESIGEREAGVASVSAPVIGADGTIVGAVSVSGPIERMSQQPGKRFGDAVIAAAAELSRALGG